MSTRSKVERAKELDLVAEVGDISCGDLEIMME